MVVLPSKHREVKRDSFTISDAMETVFQQTIIAGNRLRTIESYQYIFEQFSTVNKLQYNEDITVGTLYHYLDVLVVKPATKFIRLKST
ncbi:hypothetical protein [Sporosarcina sp. Te-1]|uniref:hypothetical protein n=1 Tax=Sporosarcina sp. Te-1 TaxID=2818390 RepID=UPI001A9DCDF6|nr:hypothetical protein [Sporosarcina sp. Te-1]QTD41878.1 hypothetical protein J3U78_03210 [Sporosarcina sp. Te-1]